MVRIIVRGESTKGVQSDVSANPPYFFFLKEEKREAPADFTEDVCKVNPVMLESTPRTEWSPCYTLLWPGFSPSQKGSTCAKCPLPHLS